MVSLPLLKNVLKDIDTNDVNELSNDRLTAGESDNSSSKQVVANRGSG